VDPLDGTTDYVKGTLDAVTTMIGFTVDERSFAGIILRVFAKEGNKYVFKPVVYFSIVSLKKVFVIEFD